MPDLTASLDVELARETGALVVPRDALRFDGEQVFVRVQRGSTLRGSAGHGRADERARSGRHVRPGRRRSRRAQRRFRSGTRFTVTMTRVPRRADGDAPGAPEERHRAPAAHRHGGHRRLRPRRQQRSARSSHHRSDSRAVRRRARNPRRHPAAQVDRAVGADAVGRAPDRQAGEERLPCQGGRRGGRVRRLHPAPDDAGEAVGAEAGGRGNRAGDGPVPHHQGAERHRADALDLQHPALEARRQQGRHRVADRERAGEAHAQRQRTEAAGAGGEGHLRRHLERSRSLRASSRSGRRRCSTSSARSAESRTCSCARRPPGWSTC